MKKLNTGNMDTYNSLYEFIYYEAIGGCGCGDSDKFIGYVKDIYKSLFEKNKMYDTPDYPEFIKKTSELIYKTEINQLIVMIFDKYDIVDHGSSIGGCWLTEFGVSLHYAWIKEMNIEGFSLNI